MIQNEEEEIDDVEDELEQQAPTNHDPIEEDEEEIHDDEDEEEEEEVHPGAGPIASLPSTFFAGLSPQFTNAALALANAANTTLTKPNLDLDIDDRKPRQQLLGGMLEYIVCFTKIVL